MKTLEEKRKARAREFYKRTKAVRVSSAWSMEKWEVGLYLASVSLQRLKSKAEEAVQPKLAEINKQLADMGYA